MTEMVPPVFTFIKWKMLLSHTASVLWMREISSAPLAYAVISEWHPLFIYKEMVDQKRPIKI